MEWEAIDTAPRDGRTVVVWDTVRQVVGRAFWDGTAWVPLDHLGAFEPDRWCPTPEDG